MTSTMSIWSPPGELLGYSQVALPAALVSRFLALEWLSKGPGRPLTAAECFDRCLDGSLDAATTAA
jgi:hypothetical protein